MHIFYGKCLINVMLTYRSCADVLMTALQELTVMSPLTPVPVTILVGLEYARTPRMAPCVPVVTAWPESSVTNLW